MPLLVTGTPMDNGPSITAVAVKVTSVGLALDETLTKLALTLTAVRALGTAFTAVNYQIGLANRAGSIGVKGTSDSFSYNANAAVIARRNALASPTDQIIMPPAPPGVV